MPEFVDRVLEALLRETGATMVGYIDETHARRYAGRSFWSEPLPTAAFPTSLKIGKSSDFDAPWPDRPSARYALVPLREPGVGISGWLYLLGGSWTGAELEQMVLSLAPIAQVVRDYTEVYKLAMYDDLTGLANDKNYYATAQQWSAERRSFSVVFMDLLDFKVLNDTLGHAEGDKALKVVAHALASSLSKERDFVARLHGDEFVALLQETQPDQFIRASREKLVPYNLMISAGWVSADGLTFEEATQLADKAMYVDKRAYKERTGRGR